MTLKITEGVEGLFPQYIYKNSDSLSINQNLFCAIVFINFILKEER